MYQQGGVRNGFNGFVGRDWRGWDKTHTNYKGKSHHPVEYIPTYIDRADVGNALPKKGTKLATYYPSAPVSGK